MLAELGVPCEFLGTLAGGALETARMEEDFARAGVATGNCVVVPGRTAPNSCVLVNRVNGSRTIIHTNKSGCNGNTI